jgi:acyl-CoA thioesterase I
VSWRLDRAGQVDDFDDGARNGISPDWSVMIMAVAIRWVLWCAVAALVTGCGSSKKAAAPPIEKAPSTLAAVPQQEDKRPIIVTFGDSISAGFGVEPGKSFPDDLQRLIDKAGFQYRVLNLGISGDTTTDGVERLSSVIVSHPEIVIVEFGGNDGLRGQPVSSSKSNLAAIIDGLQKAGSKVVLAGMTLPRNYGPEYIASFDRIFPELARQYTITLIPFILDGVGGNAALTQPDGIHPTAEGAQIVAENVMKYLKPLLQVRVAR